MGLFLINFNNQYDSNQINDTVTTRGKTRHIGLETQARYDLGTLTPTLDNVSVYASYALVNAEIREKGDTYDNQVPFSPKHKGTLWISTGPFDEANVGPLNDRQPEITAYKAICLFFM